jgi:hypothetical protein
VGHLLAAYRAGEGLTERDLVASLGITLLSLAGLAEEIGPGIEGHEMGREALIDLYQADGGRFMSR